MNTVKEKQDISQYNKLHMGKKNQYNTTKTLSFCKNFIDWDSNQLPLTHQASASGRSKLSRFQRTELSGFLQFLHGLLPDTIENLMKQQEGKLTNHKLNYILLLKLYLHFTKLLLSSVRYLIIYVPIVGNRRRQNREGRHYEGEDGRW